jgi:hypothetical protein
MPGSNHCSQTANYVFHSILGAETRGLETANRAAAVYVGSHGNPSAAAGVHVGAKKPGERFSVSSGSGVSADKEAVPSALLRKGTILISKDDTNAAGS